MKLVENNQTKEIGTITSKNSSELFRGKNVSDILTMISDEFDSKYLKVWQN